jgi:hypothetical protein
VVEGGLSGLTLGGSDLLLDSEDTKERARYNPGVRLVSELVGGLAPIAPGLGTALKLTPAGALSRAAAKAADKVGGGAALRGLTAGVVEGGGVGGGQAVTQAQLTGDPITVESVAAGIGWGALYGGAFSALGAGAAAKFEERALKAKSAVDLLDDDYYPVFRQGVDDAAAQLKKSADQIRKGTVDLSKAEPGLIDIDSLSGIGVKRTIDLPTHGIEGLPTFPSPSKDLPTHGIEGLPTFNKPKQGWDLEPTPLDELGGIGRHGLDLPTIRPDELGSIRPPETLDLKTELDSALSKMPKPKFDLRPMRSKKEALDSDLVDKGLFKEIRKNSRKAQEAINSAMAHAKEGNYTKMADALDKFEEQMTIVEATIGRQYTPPSLQKLTADAKMVSGVAREYTGKVAQVTDEVTSRVTNTQRAAQEGGELADRELRKATARHILGKEKGPEGPMYGAGDIYTTEKNRVRPEAPGEILDAKTIAKERLSSVKEPPGPGLDPGVIAKHQLSQVPQPPSMAELNGLARWRIETATQAAQEAAKIEALQSVLSQFPRTASEFATMTPARLEKLSAAVDNVGRLQSAELANIKDSVKAGVDHMMNGLGVKLEGTPGTQMREVWKMLRDAKKNERMGKSPPWAARYVLGSWASQKAGGGTPGAIAYVLGSGLAGTLVNLKGAILGTLNTQANKWVPRGGRKLKTIGPRVEPLLTRLDGEMDKKESREELLRRRAQEITQAAPRVRDALYKSIQPIAVAHPEFAAATHAHAVSRYQFILSKLPKDPGLAFSKLKSIWKPDKVAIEKFGRYYEVFHNPVKVMNEALSTGKITMEAAEGLKNMNPELFTYLRSNMLMRLSDPKVREKITYPDQVHLSILLDIPFHSTMDPRFISAQQQMYTERNQPLEMNPRVQPGGGAGRPSGPGPSATAAQRTTEH